MRLATIALALPALVLAAATALGADPADDAFASGDYLEARELWLQAAEQGDRDAQFNLGVLYDLGLGVPRDPVRAFRHYLDAADSGHAEAQFNVAVMIDAGTVRDSDPRAAALWYGRAAANGVPRAAYNLGLLYLSGSGVPENADLARHWLTVAAGDVPAASDALARIGPEEAPANLSAPEAQGGFRVEVPGGGARAELVWTAAPDGRDTSFLVQIARLPGESGGGELVPAVETPGSAVSIPLDAPEARHAWRVLRMGPEGETYAASSWAPLAAEGVEALPQGAVRFEIGAGDEDARRFAEALAPVLARNGILSRITTRDRPIAETEVRYGYEADAEFARRLAVILPGLSDGAAAADVAPALAPGEVAVALSGGLAAPVN